MKSFLRGFVYFDKERGACNCLIRDLNADGARIIFSEAIALPDVVNLHIPQKDQTLRARVSWRRGDEIGLAFTAEVSAGMPDSGELIARIAQLEDEILKLRRILRKLKRDPAGDSQPYGGGAAA